MIGAGFVGDWPCVEWCKPLLEVIPILFVSCLRQVVIALLSGKLVNVLREGGRGAAGGFLRKEELQRASQDGGGGRRNCSPKSQFIELELPSKPGPSLAPVNRPGGLSSRSLGGSCPAPSKASSSPQQLPGERHALRVPLAQKTDLRASPAVPNL